MALRMTLSLEHLIEEPKLCRSEGYKEYDGGKRHHEYPSDHLELWMYERCAVNALRYARDDDKSPSI